MAASSRWTGLDWGCAVKTIYFSSDFSKQGNQLLLKKFCLIDNKGKKLVVDIKTGDGNEKSAATKDILKFLDGRPCVFVGYDCALKWASFLMLFEKDMPPIIPSFCFDLKQIILEVSDSELEIPMKDRLSSEEECYKIAEIYENLVRSHGFELPADELLDKNESVDNSILDEPKKTLNPELWIEGDADELPRLNRDLRNKLISFAKRKAEEIGIQIKYLFMFGGSASYQYTDNSDIDCVVYAKEFKEEDYEKLSKEFKKEKEQFGQHPVSLYLKPMVEMPLEVADAVYDVLNDLWVVSPLVLPAGFDPDVFFASLIKEAERRSRSFDLKFAKMVRLQNDIDDKKKALERNPQDPVRIKRDIKDLKDEQLLLIEDLVDQFHLLHEQRHDLHRKLEEKIRQGESVSRYARFQSPEIVWKFLDKHHYLDHLKKLEIWLDNYYSERILKKEQKTKNTEEE